ncbi:hypothetical protein [Pseudoteredinibacter isoporae]|uniref:Uncharacterized protein n=1 Tax=Pseudoteredinibacter isoporae TaxID=570281 RepID=A0A7X0JRE0_9GAMM|nr:hypothetical protein [Pseudoteredinibacter isoporae]MBB6520011.1 hypothetical protein [Pseudoteredinibacter isoporae]NHO85583.1 hypothetical protein [Pseudoteredinibacter isoporae]NIB25965.1 hypothetical protein [Pseudoteredinibacter isoporae]
MTENDSDTINLVDLRDFVSNLSDVVSNLNLNNDVLEELFQDVEDLLDDFSIDSKKISLLSENVKDLRGESRLQELKKFLAHNLSGFSDTSILFEELHKLATSVISEIAEIDLQKAESEYAKMDFENVLRVNVDCSMGGFIYDLKRKLVFDRRKIESFCNLIEGEESYDPLKHVAMLKISMFISESISHHYTPSDLYVLKNREGENCAQELADLLDCIQVKVRAYEKKAMKTV